jgi:hypothetical protein
MLYDAALVLCGAVNDVLLATVLKILASIPVT